MEFIDVIKTRRNIRKFSSKNITQKTINEIIKLANLAPSAGNLQARAAVIIRNHKIIEEIRKTTFGFIKFKWTIPIVIVVLAKPEESSVKYKERGKNYALQDATIFAAYIQLIAIEKGLATGWVGTFEKETIRELLKLSKELIPIAMIPLGYGDQTKSARERKGLREIILKEI